MMWQPIETAPKSKSLWNDDPILLGKLPNDQIVKMKWDGESKPGKWCSHINSGFKYLCWLSLNEDYQPTHWKYKEGL